MFLSQGEGIWLHGPFALIGSFIAAVLSLAFYFLPSLIAKNRRHYNVTSIFLLNFFLGWTFIGWVVALVWAFTNPPPTSKKMAN